MKSLPYGKRGETALPALLFFSFVSLAFTAVSHAADAGNCRAPEEEVRAEGVYEGLECGDFCVITIKGKDRDYQAVADDEVRDILPAEGKKISLILRKKGFLRGGACAEAWFAAPAGEEKDAGTDADRGADEARHPENHGDGRHGGLEDYSLRDISADYGDTQGSAGSADREGSADAVLLGTDCSVECRAELRIGKSEVEALLPVDVMDTLPPRGTKGKAVLREARLAEGGRAWILASFTRAPEMASVADVPDADSASIAADEEGPSPDEARRSAYEAALAKCRYSREKGCAELLRNTDSAFLSYLGVLRATAGVLESDTGGASRGEADLISGKSRWLK